MTTSKQKADQPFPQGSSKAVCKPMRWWPLTLCQGTLLLALLFLVLHSFWLVTAHHKNLSKKLLFVFMCWKGHPRTLLLCKEHTELWSQTWFVWMGLGMLLKSCIIIIYISFFFLITALILVNINLYFTQKMKKCGVFYTGNSNSRTIPVESTFIKHTSMYDH